MRTNYEFKNKEEDSQTTLKEIKPNEKGYKYNLLFSALGLKKKTFFWAKI